MAKSPKLPSIRAMAQSEYQFSLRQKTRNPARIGAGSGRDRLFRKRNFKGVRRMNLISALLVMSTVASAGEPTDYKTAYKNAMQGDRPLLVLVTAEWCPPCRSLKTNTLPKLANSESIKNFHFATVDFDRDSKVARQLIEDRPIPQFVLFEKRDGRWTRKYLVGYQSLANVETFLQPAITRTASNERTRISQNNAK
jgi:thiol-disulfide isomerase/thioredoxin